MITIHKENDPYSLTMKRDGLSIGFIQWHPGRDPRVEIHDPKGGYLTLGEMQAATMAMIQATGTGTTPEVAPPLPENPVVAKGGGIDPALLP